MGIEEFADMLSPEEMEQMRRAVLEDLANLHARLGELLPEARENPGGEETVEEVYRAFHSLCGTSGLIKLDRIREVCAPIEAAAKARKLAKEPFTSDELDSFAAAAEKVGEILNREAGP